MASFWNNYVLIYLNQTILLWIISLLGYQMKQFSILFCILYFNKCIQ